MAGGTVIDTYPSTSEAILATLRCRQGHWYTPVNTRMAITSGRGRLSRICRECGCDRKRRYDERHGR